MPHHPRPEYSRGKSTFMKNEKYNQYYNTTIAASCPRSFWTSWFKNILHKFAAIAKVLAHIVLCCCCFLLQKWPHTLCSVAFFVKALKYIVLCCQCCESALLTCVALPPSGKAVRTLPKQSRRPFMTTERLVCNLETCWCYTYSMHQHIGIGAPKHTHAQTQCYTLCQPCV